MADAALAQISLTFDHMYARVGRPLSNEVVWATDVEGLLSDEHFSAAETLIKVVANLKSFRPKEGSPPSSTEPEVRLLRKGRGRKPDWRS